MFNVDNLRIYWRNKSILVPFDVIDGETDVIDFDDSMLDGYDDLSRDLVFAKICLFEYKGTSNKTWRIKEIRGRGKGREKNGGGGYEVAFKDVELKSVEGEECEKFYVGFGMQVVGEGTGFYVDGVKIKHVERMKEEKREEATKVVFNAVEADFDKEGLKDFVYFAKLSDDALEELQKQQYDPQIIVKKTFQFTLNTLKMSYSPLVLLTKLTFSKEEQTSSDTTVSSHACLGFYNASVEIRGEPSTHIRVRRLVVERARQIIMPELIPISSAYKVTSNNATSKVEAKNIKILKDAFEDFNEIVSSAPTNRKPKAGLRSFCFDVDRFIVEIVDSASGIALEAERVYCKADGSVRDLKGEGKAAMSVKCFNEIFRCYEDAVEPCLIAANLEKDVDGTSFEFNGASAVLVNVTTANVASLRNILGAWEKGHEGDIEIRSIKTEVTWKNPEDVEVEIVDGEYFRVILPEGYAPTLIPLPKAGCTSVFLLDPAKPAQTLRFETYVESSTNLGKKGGAGRGIETSKEDWAPCDSNWILELDRNDDDDDDGSNLTQTFARTRQHYASLHSKILAFPAPTSKKASIAQTLHHHEGALWCKRGGDGAKQGDFKFPLRFTVTNLGDGEVRSSGALSIENGTSSFLTLYVYSIEDNQDCQPTQSYDIEACAGLIVPAKVASEAMSCSFGSVAFSVLSPGACGGTRKFITPYLNDVGKEHKAVVNLEFGNEGVKVSIKDAREARGEGGEKNHHRQTSSKSSTQSAIYANLVNKRNLRHLSPPLLPFQCSLKINIPNMQVSFCSNLVKPFREVALLTLVGVNLSLTRPTVKIKIVGVQLDNFEPRATHPVALTSGSDETPFLQVSYQADESRISAAQLMFGSKLKASLDVTSTLAIVAFVEDMISIWSDGEKGGSSTDKNDNCGETFDWYSNIVKIDKLKVGDVSILLTWSAEGGTPGEAEKNCPEWLDVLLQAASFPNARLSVQGLELRDVCLPLSRISERVVIHYSDQVTYQLFSIISSLSVLGAPAEMMSNVGSGVERFLVKPIKGIVDGDVMEGVEEGVQGLMGGIIGGVAKSLGRVGEVLNQNLAGMMTDSDYIETRDLLNRQQSGRFTPEECDGVEVLARKFGAGVSLGFVSGTSGLLDLFESNVTRGKVARAMVGAIVKPIVGINDGIINTLHSISDADLLRPPALQARGRRALGLGLLPFDQEASMAEEIVTCGGTIDDSYLGHVKLVDALLIFSEKCLWALSNAEREDVRILCYGDICYFEVHPRHLRIVVFSNAGVEMLDIPSTVASYSRINELISPHAKKMGNAKVGGGCRVKYSPIAAANQLKFERNLGGPDLLSNMNVYLTNCGEVNEIFLSVITSNAYTIEVMGSTRLQANQTMLIRGVRREEWDESTPMTMMISSSGICLNITEELSTSSLETIVERGSEAAVVEKRRGGGRCTYSIVLGYGSKCVS
ncbi:hypothetical protein TrVE_jg4024 [Triparma verrucosa]|uniref:Uncharacterized protein n=1 Tax=Triparma verrucosa TaxID=1606542 RepID=A0A9W6ZD05_9STRA|nr:hypothetical protein TrVE_jg4024 [Triparma verrucosa]